jgi:hypothetical protein
MGGMAEATTPLPWNGREVTSICIDFAFTIDLWRHDDGNAGVRIEAPFVLRTAAGEDQFNPEAPREQLVGALTLFGKTIDRAEYSDHGTLEIVFTDGVALYQAGSGDGYEAWTLHGPGDLEIISVGNHSVVQWTEHGIKNRDPRRSSSDPT